MKMEEFRDEYNPGIHQVRILVDKLRLLSTGPHFLSRYIAEVPKAR